MSDAFAAPASPSGSDTSEIETVGAASSSVMVPVPTTVPGSTFTRFESCRSYVSSNSSMTSPWIVTSTVFVVCPGANDSVPVAAA